MKNKLVDLNNHLFEQIERLNDEELTGEELEKEIKRSKAITSLASNVISNAALALEGEKYINDFRGSAKLPEMLVEKNSK